MSIADLVQSMLARGIDHDLIVQAVREAEAPKAKKPKQLHMLDDDPLRGSRLPASWIPSPADMRFAQEAGMPVERVWDECNQFRDYYRSCAAERALRRDWSATWRNWVRRALRMNPERAPERPYDSAI